MTDPLPSARAGAAGGGGRGSLVASVLLAAGVVAVYAQVTGFEFVGADDQTYITENPVVRGGLDAESLRWAFTTGHAANWHPLTWLSHLLDVDLFGTAAGGHHATNLLLHLLNAQLLFWLLLRMTGSLWPSAWVAALFALHPMHVESVAWVSERKDVLSSFFGLLSLHAYLAYVKGSSRAYLATCGLLALSLLAKPMLVTLPFVLLLLDYWPLQRLGSLRARVQEKVPLFAIAAMSCVATLVAQRGGGAVRSVEAVAPMLRIANAGVAYVLYVVKTAWPTQLSILYPHPFIAGTGGEPLAAWQIAGAFALLGGVSALVLWLRRPYAIVGWLFYLGTLVPVIGLVQVGNQALADRYSYLPSVGLFVIVAWGGAELASSLRARLRFAPIAIAGLGGVAVVACAVLSWQQTLIWRDSLTLFRHAVEVTPNNSIVHSALAAAMLDEQLYTDAERHSRIALTIKPDYSSALLNLGSAMQGQGKSAEAIRHYRHALALGGDEAKVRCNLANALSSRELWREAILEYELSLALEPQRASCWHNFGNAERALGRHQQAANYYDRALEVDPNFVLSHYMLGRLSEERGRRDEAVEHYRRALELDPSYGPARRSLDRALRDDTGSRGSR